MVGSIDSPHDSESTQVLITGPNNVHRTHTFDPNALLKPIKKIN